MVDPQSQTLAIELDRGAAGFVGAVAKLCTSTAVWCGTNEPTHKTDCRISLLSDERGDSNPLISGLSII